MEILTTTPFGRRPVTAGLIERAQAARGDLTYAEVNKWEILRQIICAKKQLGLTSGAITVLQALLSFYRGDTLRDDGLIVFPSNRTLGNRAQGMPESTLRRNLNLLVKAGLIQRHDSPNGKRYAVRDSEGDIARAFGFDLRPLLVRAPDLEDMARDIQKTEAEIKRSKERAALLNRDCEKLLEFARVENAAGPWDQVQVTLAEIRKHLRRVLTLCAVESLCEKLAKIRNLFVQMPANDAPGTAKPSGCDDQNERHIQSSKKEKIDSERTEFSDRRDTTPPSVPVEIVLQACPDVKSYATEDIRHNHQLVEFAHFLHRMMGITPEVWHRALQTMGSDTASVTLSCILQRMDKIRNPSAYLLVLTRKAEAGKFSPWPMIRSLLPSGALSPS
jgi:replication initiation protein RepC